ncbi:MAG: hypothetical protein E7421_01135 [Ruminococcaceae bacterium]|nr:hypothetical protein [Oscillospiraceae bacterium]
MNLTKMKKLLFGGLSFIMVGNFLSKAVSMISSIVVARVVDKAEYGYLAYADNLYQYIGLFTGLGLASALLVVCTPDVSLEKQHAYLRKAVIRGGVFELAMSILLCVLAQTVAIPFPEARKYIWLLIAIPPVSFTFNAMQAFVRVKRNNKLYATLGVIQTAAICVFGIGFVLLLDAIGLVIARYLAVFIVLVLAIRYIRKTDGAVVCEQLNREENKKYMSTALSLMLANMFSGMLPINESFIINHLIKDEMVTANFRVAGSFPSLIILITSAIMVYYFPIIAAMKDGKQIKKTVFQLAGINGVLILTATAVGMLLTPFFLKLLYGAKYANAVPLTYPLWIMRAINAMFRMVPLNVLPAIGKAKFSAVVSVCTCVVHGVLDYLFISWWNVGGIAYAAMIVYVLSGCAMWICLLRTCAKK